MIGIGVDIVEIERIENVLKRYGERFVNRIFTEKEKEYCYLFKNYAEKFAGKFAAKEAVSKAFGTGIANTIRWRDIEILHNPLGKPYVTLYNSAKKFFDQYQASQILVTISDTKAFALAIAIME